MDEAIRFLRRARPMPPLALSPGLCLAAANHCREPGWRCRRTSRLRWGRSRTPNQSLWRSRARLGGELPTTTAAGAAYDLHARYGSVCSIDFASAYAEGTFVRNGDRCHAFVLTTQHQLSVAVLLTHPRCGSRGAGRRIPRFFENRLNGWIGLKQRVA